MFCEEEAWICQPWISGTWTVAWAVVTEAETKVTAVRKNSDENALRMLVPLVEKSVLSLSK